MVPTRGGGLRAAVIRGGGAGYWMQNPEVPDRTPSTSA
jgi:hypothetical protein